MQKNLFKIALATAGILFIPLVGMQFTNEVNWTLIDFIVAGTLLLATGLIFDLGMRNARNTKYRIIIGVIITVAFFYLWAELAVGIFTNWGS